MVHTHLLTYLLLLLLLLLAATIGEEVDTLEDVYEPYLIQIGFIARTLRGRMVLPPAYAHIGYDFKG